MQGLVDCTTLGGVFGKKKDSTCHFPARLILSRAVFRDGMTRFVSVDRHRRSLTLFLLPQAVN
jgi:hypothetical protein